MSILKYFKLPNNAIIMVSHIFFYFYKEKTYPISEAHQTS